MRLRSAAARALWLALTASACGGHPTGPTPPPVDNITLTCPAAIRVENVVGPTQDISFAAPTVTGGAPPIAITCSPSSGSGFPIGETTVNCSATDGVRSGVCSFKVTLVARIPVLGIKSFLAFGDSITRGENGDNPARVFVIDEANSYPVIFGSLLRNRYTTQSFDVAVSGVSGEDVKEGAERIGGVLDAVHPQALLLLEGVNDCVNGAPCSPSAIRDALRSDIQQAKARGAAVFLSTLLPIDGTGFRGRTYQWPLIGGVNDAIRGLASAENVSLVDNWTAFQGHATAGDYLDTDGLHPSPAGNRVIAQMFLDAVAARFESAASSSHASPGAALLLPIPRGAPSAGSPGTRAVPAARRR